MGSSLSHIKTAQYKRVKLKQPATEKSFIG